MNNDLDAVKQLLYLSESAVSFFLRKLFQHYASGDATAAYPAIWMTVYDLTKVYNLVERPRDEAAAEM